MPAIDTLPTPEKVKDSDGLSIAYRTWMPADEPKAVVLIVPGFNSHSGYYGGTAEYLKDRGLRCTQWTCAAAACPTARGSMSTTSTNTPMTSLR